MVRIALKKGVTRSARESVKKMDLIYFGLRLVRATDCCGQCMQCNAVKLSTVVLNKKLNIVLVLAVTVLAVTVEYTALWHA